MGVAGQGDVGVLRVQEVRGGVHLYVFKGSSHNVRYDGVNRLSGCPVLGLALHHLPQAEEHAANSHQNNAAVQEHTRHSNPHAQ